jgi:hypothetical protein
MRKTIPIAFQTPIFALRSNNLKITVFLDVIRWLFGIACPIIALFTLCSTIKMKALSFEFVLNITQTPILGILFGIFILFAFAYLIMMISLDVFNS